MFEIHRQIIATGREWKPCVECVKDFEPGEILTAINHCGVGGGVRAWYCEQCLHEHFGFLLAKSWRQTWRLHNRGERKSVDIEAASREMTNKGA